MYTNEQGILRNFSPRLLMWEDAQVIARHEKLSPLHPHASVPLKHLGWGEICQSVPSFLLSIFFR